MMDLLKTTDEAHCSVIHGESEACFGARIHRGLAAAESPWRAIEADGVCTPFQRFDWVTTLVRFGVEEDSAVFVVEVFDRMTHTPLMLLPLVKQSKGLLTTFRWLGADVCDYFAPLFSPNVSWTPSAVLAAWRAIRKVLPRADLLRIDHMPSLVAGRPNPLTRLGATRQSRTTTCGLSVDGDPATVLERCADPSFVKKLGKTGRRLAQRGAVTFVEATTRAEVDDLFDALVEQRRTRFRKLDRVDLLDQPNFADFYRAAAVQGLQGGPVRLLGLRVGDQWVGTYYGLMHGSVFQGLIVTIADESWRTCSPGLHVHAHVIRWVNAKGLRFFDMSVGPAAYKDQIGGARTALSSLDHALSFRGALILSVMRAIAGIKDNVRKNQELYDGLKRLGDIIAGLPKKARGMELLPWRQTKAG